MICMFCYDSLEKVSHPGSENFVILRCRGCQSPDYHTLHRELYLKDSDVKLYDQIQVDEFIVTRYFRPTKPNGPYNYTKLYKESIGVIDNAVEATPVGSYPPICQFNQIVELPTYDLGVLKNKLKLWTTFS